MSANTMYSLTVCNSTASGNRLGFKNAPPFTTSDGYAVNNGLFSTNISSSWSTVNDRTAIQLSVVPEPSAFGPVLLACLPAVVRLVRRRRSSRRRYSSP